MRLSEVQQGSGYLYRKNEWAIGVMSLQYLLHLVHLQGVPNQTSFFETYFALKLSFKLLVLPLLCHKSATICQIDSEKDSNSKLKCNV